VDSGVVGRIFDYGTNKKCIQSLVWKLKERGKLADLVVNREKILNNKQMYMGADKSLAQPGRKQTLNYTISIILKEENHKKEENKIIQSKYKSPNDKG
jgi:hypothetical protein